MTTDPAAPPPATPLTGVMVAIEVLLLVHVPPVTLLLNVVVDPSHIEDIPVISVGDTCTVTVVVA